MTHSQSNDQTPGNPIYTVYAGISSLAEGICP